MQKEAFARALMSFGRRAAFRPFVIELVSGPTIAVEHPEAIAFHGAAAAHVDPDGEITLLDHEGVCGVHEAREASSQSES